MWETKNYRLFEWKYTSNFNTLVLLHSTRNLQNKLNINSSNTQKNVKFFCGMMSVTFHTLSNLTLGTFL